MCCDRKIPWENGCKYAPFKSFEVTKVQEITRQFPRVHGEPIHLGDPTKIGINNLSKPDFGDKVTIKTDEIPFFGHVELLPDCSAKCISTYLYHSFTWLYASHR